MQTLNKNLVNTWQKTNETNKRLMKPFFFKKKLIKPNKKKQLIKPAKNPEKKN